MRVGKACPSGGIGIRVRLKIEWKLPYGFKSHLGHHEYRLCGVSQKITPNRGIFYCFKQSEFNTIHIGVSHYSTARGECVQLTSDATPPCTQYTSDATFTGMKTSLCYSINTKVFFMTESEHFALISIASHTTTVGRIVSSLRNSC